MVFRAQTQLRAVSGGNGDGEPVFLVIGTAGRHGVHGKDKHPVRRQQALMRRRMPLHSSRSVNRETEPEEMKI